MLEISSTGHSASALVNLSRMRTQGLASIQANGATADETSPKPAERELARLQKLFDHHMRSEPVRHDNVFVLLLSWDDDIDELKVKPEVDELAHVFEKTYGYTVEHKLLNIERSPQTQVNKYLATFVDDHNTEHTLLIIYYAGHGWHDGKSNSLKLTAKTSQISQDERNRHSIAWESAESNIKSTIADVLVIFDCCEAGSLGQHHRSPMRTFEFLGACARGQLAHSPGPHSFTTALIWALGELKNEWPFRSLDLVHKIQEAPDFPKKDQSPQLIPRFGPSDDHVWIAPLNASKEAPEGPIGEYRQPALPEHEYLDLRLHFYRSLNDKDVENTAKAFSRLIEHKDPDFAARRIFLIRKRSLRMDIEPMARHWQDRARKRKRSSVDEPASASSLISLRGEVTTSQTHALTTDLVVARPKLKADVVEGFERSAVMAADGDSAMLHDGSPPHIRRRLTNASETDQPNGGARYHFRMLLTCTMENCQAVLGRVADQIRPNVYTERSTE